MKNFTVLLFAALFLAGCTGMSTTDGDTTKDWIKIDSSKSDLDGKITDVCYRLTLRFSPPEAAYYIDTDMACITKCCWYSERSKVEINLNDAFARNMAARGRAIKFTPEKLTFHLSYSSFLNTIHGRAEPRSALKSGGLIMLEAQEITAQTSRLPVSNEPVSAAQYEDNMARSAYLFKSEPAPAAAARITQVEETMPSVNEYTSVPPAGELQEHEDYLQKRLAYEREQAVLLLKRFYNNDIDAYIMSLDKAQKTKGMILLANDRSWITAKVGSPIYRVTCKVNGQLGKTAAAMKPHPIDCGVFQVDLDEKIVRPLDAVARTIVSGEFRN